MAKKFYAVRNGKINGVYESWDECKKQVMGFKGARYKGFETREEAVAFVRGDDEKPKAHEETVAYVDGSYNIKTGEYSYGVVILHNGEEITMNKAFSDKDMAAMRNVAGEIMGASCAMEWARENGVSEIGIYYDYQGIESWCTGEWKTNKEGTSNYAELYKEISKTVKVNFHKVKGHSGDKYNDMADRLAKDALGIE